MCLSVTTVHQTSKQDKICCTCRSRCHSKKGCPCRAAHVLCTERCHIQHSCTNIQIPEDAATIDLTQYDDQKISTQSRKGPSKWICCGEVTLTNEHMKTLQSEREWIDDDLIHAGQTLLQTSIHTWVASKNQLLVPNLLWSRMQGSSFRSCASATTTGFVCQLWAVNHPQSMCSTVCTGFWIDKRRSLLLILCRQGRNRSKCTTVMCSGRVGAVTVACSQ